MKNKKIYLQAGILLIAVYCAGYAYFRFAGDLTRVQGKGTNQGNQIWAKTDPWDELGFAMAENSGSSFSRSLSKLRRTKAPILNGLFWPLRELESAYWNTADR